MGGLAEYSKFAIMLIILNTKSAIGFVNESLSFVPYLNTASLVEFSSLPINYTNISLPTQFRFFGKNYSNVYASVEGALTFEKELKLGPFGSYCRDYAASSPTIAVYMQDIKQSMAKMYFKIDTDKNSTEKVATDVQAAFPLAKPINLIWMLSVTWHEVHSALRQYKSTFQAVITTDGQKSFVLFNYINITSREYDWFSPHKTPAVGFFGGPENSKYSYAVPHSCSKSIKKVLEQSNIDKPGKFVFQVDTKLILPSVSESCKLVEKFKVIPDLNLRVHFTPNVVPALGIMPLLVNGLTSLCINHSVKNITCVFKTPANIIQETTSGKSYSKNRIVVCSKPDLNTIGLVNINVRVAFVNNDTLVVSGVVYVIPETRNAVKIELGNPNQRESSVFLSYNLSKNEAINALTDLFPSENDGNSFYLVTNFLENYKHSWWKLYKVGCHFRENKCSAPLQFDNSVTKRLFAPTALDAELRAVSLTNTRSLDNEEFIEEYVSNILQTTFDFLQFKTRDQGQYNTFDKKCRVWLETEVAAQSDIEPCPVTLKQAQLDWRFHESLLTEDNGDFNSYNFSVYIQSVPSDSGTGIRCVYNLQGELMYKPPYGSRLDSQSPNSQIFYLDHYLLDMVPYMECCLLSIQKEYNCRKYLSSKRAPYSENAYEFPVPFRVTGATQISSIAGVTYLVNNDGAFYFAKVQNHFEFKIILNKFFNSTADGVPTVVTNAVITFNNSVFSKIQVSANQRHGLLVWVDDQPLNFYYNEITNETGSIEEQLIYNYGNVTVINNGTRTTTIAYANLLSVQIKAIAENTSLDIVGSVAEQLSDIVEGLVANENESPQFVNQVVEQWRCRNDIVLQKYPVNNITFVNNKRSVSTQTYQLSRLDTLKYVPALVTEFCQSNENCIVDYQLTGDRKFAKSSAESYALYEKLANVSKTNFKQRQCTNFAISNATVFNPSTYHIGAVLKYTCHNGYYIKLIINDREHLLKELKLKCVATELHFKCGDFCNATWISLEHHVSVDNTKIECILPAQNTNHQITHASTENAYFGPLIMMTTGIVFLGIGMILAFYQVYSLRKLTTQSVNAPNNNINLLDLDNISTNS